MQIFVLLLMMSGGKQLALIGIQSDGGEENRAQKCKWAYLLQRVNAQQERGNAQYSL